jgi:phosphatidate phosphatase APP1
VKIPFVDVYASHGRPERFVLTGRAVELDSRHLKEDGRGKWREVLHNLRRFRLDQLVSRQVRLSVLGRTLEVSTDADGGFHIELAAARSLFPAGFAAVTARVLGPQGEPLDPESTGAVQVIGKRARYALVSDIDDTILESNVAHRRQLIWNTFARGADRMRPVPGMADVYRELAAAGREKPGVFYVSGSPVNLHRKLSAFLELNGFPPGSFILKNLGLRSIVPEPLQAWGPFAKLAPADPLVATEDYKTRHLRALMTELAELKFVLIGDSGEKDPEVYASLARDPVLGPRVAAIYIRNATGADPRDERFAGQLLFSDPGEVADDLRRRKIVRSRRIVRAR